MIEYVYMDPQIDALRTQVKLRLSGKRYLHTLGVEAMACRLGEIFLPDKIPHLRAAAILHDVAKELDVDEQLALIDGCQYIKNNQGCPIPALHSFSGVAVVIKDFPDFAVDDILDAVMNHTLGSPDMDVFSEVIFLSDYIEEGRPYFESAVVRSTLFDRLEKAETDSDRLKALHFATVLSLNYTFESLSKRGVLPDKRSLNTKIAFEALI